MSDTQTTAYPWQERRRAPKGETAEMLQMRKLGMTYRAIGEHFGVTGHSVLVRLGCKPTRRTPYRRPGEAGYRTL
jgi:hypothetical protein